MIWLCDRQRGQALHDQSAQCISPGVCNRRRIPRDKVRRLGIRQRSAGRQRWLRLCNQRVRERHEVRRGALTLWPRESTRVRRERHGELAVNGADDNAQIPW